MRSEYRELLSLTKIYLLQEFSEKDWKICEKETFEFFKAHAKKQKALPKSLASPKEKVVESQQQVVKPHATEPPQQVTKPLATEPPQQVLKSLATEPQQQVAKPLTTEPQQQVAKPLTTEPPQQVVKPHATEPAQQVAKPPQKKDTENPSIQIELPQSNTTIDTDDIKTFMKNRFPSVTYLPTPPDDSAAKNLMAQHKQTASILILSFDKLVHPFLKNLSTALNQEVNSTLIIPAQRIEKENEWEEILKQQQLKLIIASDYGLYSLQNLMCYYREIPKHAKYFLGKIPLLLLTDLSLYLKEPKLKPSLWRAICQQIKAS